MPETYQDLQRSIVQQLQAGPDAGNITPSIIPIQNDYTSDSARCLTSIVFLPEDLAAEIWQAIIAPLAAIEPDHHYYEPAAMHVTIKNIRTVHDLPLFTPHEIERVDHLFQAIIPRHRPFVFSLEDLVAFPTSCALIGYCDERLQELAQALDSGLRSIGVADNKQYVSDTIFFGNVTVCRYRRSPSRRFLEAVDRLKHTYRRELPVTILHLIICNSVYAPESRQIVSFYAMEEVEGNKSSGHNFFGSTR